MTELDLPQDYVDLLHELHDAEVEFVLVGGWAVAVHGHGRATDDMDVFIRATPGNAARVFAALRSFGAPLDAHGVTEELFAEERYGYRMGRKPLLIEILTSIDGVSFDEAAKDAIDVNVAGVRVPVIGLQSLLKNKCAAGRPKDLADIDALERDG